MSAPISAKFDIYRHVLRAARHFCQVDEFRPVLQGIHIQQDGENVVVTATDGFFCFRSINAGKMHEGELPEDGIVLHHSYVKNQLKGKIVMDMVDIFHYTEIQEDESNEWQKQLQHDSDDNLPLDWDKFPDASAFIVPTMKRINSPAKAFAQNTSLEMMGAVVTGLSEFHGGKKKYKSNSSPKQLIQWGFSGEKTPFVVKTKSSEGVSAMVVMMPCSPIE